MQKGIDNSNTKWYIIGMEKKMTTKGDRMKLKDTKPGDIVRVRFNRVKVEVIEHYNAGTYTAVRYLRKGSNPETRHGYNSDAEVRTA